MEQVEGGDLVVNRGDESRPKSNPSEQRDLNAVDGLDAAIKLAQVCLCVSAIQLYIWLMPSLG